MTLWQRLKNICRRTVSMETRYYYNGSPATPEQEQEIREQMREMDEQFKDLKDRFKERYGRG